MLDDLLVSRWHAELRRVDGRWHIRDLSSANGTYVNGRRVTEAAVEPDSVIGIGRSLLQLVDDRLVIYVDTGDVDFEARELVVTTRQGRRLLDGVSFALGARSLLAVVGPQRLGQHDSSLKTHLLGDPRPRRLSCGEVDGRLDSTVASKARLHGPPNPATGPCPGSAPGARDHRRALICR